MAKHHKLELTEDEIQTLVDLRDNEANRLIFESVRSVVENP